MNEKVIGILGGMGPEATADLYYRIIKKTKVQKDQDHFRIIIDSNAKIPDRTKAILYGGESPVEEMVKSLKVMEAYGVDVACMPCFTAHYYIEELKKRTKIQIVSIFEELNTFLKEEKPNMKKVGVLATTGTVKMNVFDRYLELPQVIYPTERTQEKMVMDAIYGTNGVKMGNTKGKPIEKLVVAASELEALGAEAVIAGCTEICLTLRQDYLDTPLLDPLDILVDALIQ